MTGDTSLLTPEEIAQARDRIGLVDLVGRTVPLTRQGHEHVGLCPFHNEKTPSFHVVEGKGFFHCFGCGAHGDQIAFVMRSENRDFVEAVRKLAGMPEIGRPAKAAHKTKTARQTSCSDDWWPPAWKAAVPISNTLAARYLTARGLRFDDPEGRVLRCAESHPRTNPEGKRERHPAMLSALCDPFTAKQVGIINCYLLPDGSGRIRDRKGKSSWGRAGGSIVLLSDHDEPTYGLTICEGTETGIALLMTEQTPVWCCGGAPNIEAFPLLGGLECLTVAADNGAVGQDAAARCAERWRRAGREVVVISPPAVCGDWADDLPGDDQ